MAVVQAEILRCLLFGSRADNDIDETLVQGKNKTDESEIPSPSEFELQIMLGEAFLTILNRVRQQGQPIVIVKSNQLPCNFENMNTSHSSESADDNGNNKSSFSIAKFDEPGDEVCFVL